MKLKTLKEIQLEEGYDGGITEQDTKENIRKEAIKWIKQIRKSIESGGKEMPEQLTPYHHLEDWKEHCVSIIVWIRMFFEIEEDLEVQK